MNAGDASTAGTAGGSAPPAADDPDRRFGGLERLYGRAGAARLRSAHAMVVGIGGVGSWAAEALARSGIGCLTLVDLDHVSESNINRQVHALTSTIGQAKVEAMRERIAQINADCRVMAIDDFVEPGNWRLILDAACQAHGPVHVTIDACDQARAKLAMAAWARETRAGFITVGAAGGKRRAEKVEIDDLARATHDPLLAQLRHRLRKEHGAPREGRALGIACVFSREAVAPPDASCTLATGDGSLNCHGYGSVVSVTATFGQCAAGWVIDRIAGNSTV